MTHAYTNGKKVGTRAEMVRERTVRLVSVLMFVGLMVGVNAVGNASAAGTDVFGAWAGLAIAGLVVGVALLVTYGFLVKFGSKRAKSKWLPVGVLGLLLAVIVLLPMAGAWLIGGVDLDGGNCAADEYKDPDTGECIKIGKTGNRWVLIAPALTGAGGGQGSAAHDAITEFPDGPFVALDGGTPDLNNVIADYRSTITAFIDRVNHLTSYDIAVDDDVASTAAAFLATDADVADFQFRLDNAVDLNGDGTNDQVPFFGRVTSISRVSGTINNGTAADVFYCDQTAGWYLGFGREIDEGAAHTSDHTYISFTPSLSGCPNGMPSSGPWRNLGNDDGDSAFAAFWWGFGSRAGFSDYGAPPVGTAIIIQTEWGTPGQSVCANGDVSDSCNVGWTFSLRLSART